MDVASREAIEESLASFRGTILVVSHDRYFLDKIATAVVEVRDGAFHRYPGEPDEFWQEWAASSREVSGRVSTRGQEHRSATRRAEARAATPGKEVGDRELERRIKALEAEKVSVEEAVSGAFEQGEHQKGRTLSRRHERVLKLLDELYAERERGGG
jgi:ATP-binding cassette subfamily F protein 3